MIAVEILRKAQRGLIAVTRHTSAHVPGLQMPTKAKNVFTEGKKGAKWRKKRSPSGNRTVDKASEAAAVSTIC